MFIMAPVGLLGGHLGQPFAYAVLFSLHWLPPMSGLL
jgi:hypothetical protein